MRSTITDIGRVLLARLELGEISLEFTKVAVGSGIYMPTESISAATALKSPKNTYLLSATEETRDGILITSVISNVDGAGHSVVDEDYRMNELGIFVEVDGVEYLYMLGVANNDSGNILPAFTGNNAIDYVEKFALTFTNTAQVTVQMSGAYALNDDVDRKIATAVRIHTADHVIHVSEQERIHWNDEQEAEIEFNQDGSITETTDKGTKTTTFNQDGSITETFPDGRSLLTEFNQDGSISRILVTNQQEGDDAS